MTQSATLPPPRRFIGCDVGKETIAVHDSHGGETRVLPNAAEALAAFAATLDEDCLVVCEATGGYETALLEAAVSAGVPAHRADARRVKAFIRSLGTLAKTDALDARALARYGAERHAALTRWRPRDKARERLRQLVAARQDMVRDRAACRNRLSAPGAEAIAPRLKRIAAVIDAEIAGVDDDIARLIDSNPRLKEAVATLRAIKGLGATTAASLLALMPELGTLGRRQAAALAGLAPHPRQSGKADAYRRTKGGRPQVRRALFMATLAAVRYNPVLKAFYQRLRANGKKPLVAITAAMRKLITIANAKLRDAQIDNFAN